MSPASLLTFVILIAAGVIYYLWGPKPGGEKGASSASSKRGSKGNVLEKFTRDLTADAQSKALDPVVGREEEIERVIHILTRRSKNNPLLLGEPGVGKTAIVEGIARRIVAKNVPDNLLGKRVLGLDLPGLISGTKYRGEFEERMKQLTDQIASMNREVILFIDEIHMIEQAKGSEGALNVSDILKPALSRGELQAIGATTWKEYDAFIKPDDALNRRFQPVIVGEPSESATLEILRGIKDAYEKHHHIQYEDAALQAAVTLAKKYIADRFLPDKAIDLIDEAGAKVSIESTHGAKHAMGLLHAAGADVAGRSVTLGKEQQELQAELGHMKTLAGSHPEESELAEIQKKIEHLLSAVDELQKEGVKTEGPPHVTAEDIREVVAQWTGKPLAEIH